MRLESWQIATLELTNGITVSVPSTSGDSGRSWLIETTPHGVRVHHDHVVRFYSWSIVAQFSYRMGAVTSAAS